MQSVKAIIYLPEQSRYTPRVDSFHRTGEELGSRLVYEGRALEIDEFNRVFPTVVQHSREKWGVEPHVELVLETIAAPAADVVMEQSAATPPAKPAKRSHHKREAAGKPSAGPRAQGKIATAA